MREGQKTPAARAMRKAMTAAEVRLWVHLKDRQRLGERFRRQHPVGPYIADFACVARGLIVEVDGPGHFEDGAGERDAVRTAYLEREGWRVLRVTNDAVRENIAGVVAAIEAALGVG